MSGLVPFGLREADVAGLCTRSAQLFLFSLSRFLVARGHRPRDGLHLFRFLCPQCLHLLEAFGLLPCQVMQFAPMLFNVMEFPYMAESKIY